MRVTRCVFCYKYVEADEKRRGGGGGGDDDDDDDARE
jgi:hypothetical protein